jgi:hypothetical protein
MSEWAKRPSAMSQVDEERGLFEPGDGDLFRQRSGKVRREPLVHFFFPSFEEEG